MLQEPTDSESDSNLAVAQSAPADGHRGLEVSQQQTGKPELTPVTASDEPRPAEPARRDEQLQGAAPLMAPESCSVDQERCCSETGSECTSSAEIDDVLPEATEADKVVLAERDKEEKKEQEEMEEKEEEEESEKTEEDEFRSRIRRELATLPLGDSLEYITEPGTWQTSVVQEVAEEMNMWSHVSEEGPACLSARSNSLQAMQAPSGDVVLVHNSLVTANAVREQLLGIEVFDQLEFPTSLTEAQRQVVHILAAELGLSTHSEGQGIQRRVVAYNMGDLAAQIRRDLSWLLPGESKVFPQSFTLAQQRLVHVIAAELGLWVHTPRSSASACIEVHNLKDWAEQVRRDLEQLVAGEHLEFPPELTELQRKIVHCIAGELGCASLSQGEGASRFVVVANLAEFSAEVRRDLCNLAPGESRMYAPALSVLQRKVVNELAAELGLCSESRDEGDGRHIVISRPGDGDMEQLRRRRHSAEEAPELASESAASGPQKATDAAMRRSESKEAPLQAEGEETEESVISRLFSVYATGNYNGERIFLRFPDLREFAEDAKDAMPDSYKRFHTFASNLESIFDDTLQLQIDMGTRTRKGLTLHWFQVFIQKAMRCIGRSVVGFLFALVSSRTQ